MVFQKNYKIICFNNKKVLLLPKNKASTILGGTSPLYLLMEFHSVQNI